MVEEILASAVLDPRTGMYQLSVPQVEALRRVRTTGSAEEARRDVVQMAAYVTVNDPLANFTPEAMAMTRRNLSQG